MKEVVKLEVYRQGSEYHANLAFREDSQYQHYDIVFQIWDEEGDIKKVEQAAISWCRKNGIKRVSNLFYDKEEKDCDNCRNQCLQCDCYHE